MQDLNDKVNDGGATVNGVLPASQWNEVASELQNLITSTGEALSGGDLLQLVKAVSLYAHKGNFYATGGTANAITLTPVGSYNAPTSYTDGMEVRFEVASTNTGATTINVNGIGSANLLNENLGAMSSGYLLAGRRFVATYRSTSSAFVLAAQDRRATMIVQDKRASGTDGGTFNSGSWATRDLNTTLINNINGASLSSNQVTLPAGTYEITGRAGATGVNLHKIRLNPISGTMFTAIIGTNENTTSGGTSTDVTTWSSATGIVSLTATTVFELQHRCSTTQATIGRGVAVTFGVDELYAEVVITAL